MKEEYLSSNGADQEAENIVKALAKLRSNDYEGLFEALKNLFYDYTETSSTPFMHLTDIERRQIVEMLIRCSGDTIFQLLRICETYGMTIPHLSVKLPGVVGYPVTYLSVHPEARVVRTGPWYRRKRKEVSTGKTVGKIYSYYPSDSSDITEISYEIIEGKVEIGNFRDPQSYYEEGMWDLRNEARVISSQLKKLLSYIQGIYNLVDCEEALTHFLDKSLLPKKRPLIE